MEQNFHYDTVSEAINNFRQKGYVIDFNLEENCIVCDHKGNKFNTDDFEIVDMYRYAGNSDPADEAAVYAIESKLGLKGVLVTGYGVSSDPAISGTLGKIKFRKNIQM